MIPMKVLFFIVVRSYGANIMVARHLGGALWTDIIQFKSTIIISLNNTQFRVGLSLARTTSINGCGNTRSSHTHTSMLAYERNSLEHSSAFSKSPNGTQSHFYRYKQWQESFGARVCLKSRPGVATSKSKPPFGSLLMFDDCLCTTRQENT